MHLHPGDERPHEPGDDPSWAEWWFFEFATPGRGLAGHVRLCLLPCRGTVLYWASLAGRGRSPVVVHDEDVRLPRAGSLEIRAEGLWADHILERPFEQVTVGCEAFGLRLDSAADLELDPVVGERVPLGLDLEWETVAGSPPAAAVPGPGYALPCEVHGLVLVGEESLPLETGGRRSHGWGPQPPPIVPTDLDA